MKELTVKEQLELAEKIKLLVREAYECDPTDEIGLPRIDIQRNSNTNVRSTEWKIQVAWSTTPRGG